MYRNLKPAEAKQLLEQDEGWTYLDVRTEEEFAAGHPPGAYNVPFALSEGGYMAPNPDFVDVVLRHFTPDRKLLVGCAAGGRSMRACAMLAAEGFTQIANVFGGFSGARNPGGELIEAGWQECGYPVEGGEPPDRCYASLIAG